MKTFEALSRRALEFLLEEYTSALKSCERKLGRNHPETAAYRQTLKEVTEALANKKKGI